jgi:hypothetical protein
MTKLQVLEAQYNEVEKELTDAVEAYNQARALMERLQEKRVMIKREYREVLEGNNK